VIGAGPNVGDAAQPKLDGLEVDLADHLDGHQGVAHGGGQERAVGQRLPRTGEPGDEDPLAGPEPG
jgi:hypothetical protein